MKNLLAVAVLLFPTLAFCDVPEFIRSLPTTGFVNPLIDKDGNEEIMLDGKPAIRTRDGRIIRALATPMPQPEIAKVVERTPERHTPPVFEDDPDAPQFTLTWEQDCIARLKKIVNVPLATFRAAPVKIEQKVCDILPIPDRQHATKKTSIPYNLDVKEFIETSRETEKIPAILPAPKTETKATPTENQLRLMKQYGYDAPPTIVHLDGSVTKGVSIFIPSGENQYSETSNKVQYGGQGPVECESCKLRGVRR